MREVSPDAFLEENNLTVNISALRRALGGVSSGRLYIQTLPRRGYRFTARVRQTEQSTPYARARPAGAEIDSNTLVGIDHFHAGDRQKTDPSIRAAESILAKDEYLRRRFEMRLRAARAEQTLSRPDALALLEKATHYRARKYMAEAHRLLARIAVTEDDPAAAEAHLNSAIQILQEFPAPLAAWKTHLAMGRWQAQLGRPAAARTSFAAAASMIR